MRQPSALLIGILLAFGSMDASIAAPATRPVPARSTQVADLPALRALLKTPEAQIDLAEAKLTIDQLIDPTTDAYAIRLELDVWTDAVRANTPAGATTRQRLDALLTTLYKPGPWNDHQPFQYDLTDPFGRHRQS